MFLSKIELVGFKSFANKTTINFNSGITGIVGPNGCGKSNVVDAIRWVLGEQKTSVLRSDKMENVIFNGAVGKRRLGFAEVSLTILNTKNILPTDFSEVMIARRLFRSGESEYLMNKKVCRLKDINNILMDSGMGPDAYSVIELKMVEDILDDKDFFRRRLLEEAAGITRYKVRRNESLRKLDATRTDLIRVRDNITEVERWVRGLKSQVNKAVRYKKLIEEVRDLEGTYYNAYRTSLITEIEPKIRRIKDLENEITQLSGTISKGEAAVEAIEKRIVDKQGELRVTQDGLNEVLNELRTTENRHASMMERKEAYLRTSKRLSEEIIQFEAKIEEVEQQAENIESSGSDRVRDLEKEEKELEATQIKRDKFLTSYREKKSIFQGKNQQSFDVINQLSDKMRQRDSIGKVKEERAIQLDKLRQSHSGMVNHLKDLGTKIEGYKKEESSAGVKLEGLKKEKDDIQQALDNNAETVFETNTKVNNKKLALESLTTKLDFLTNLVEEHGDMPGGVSELLKAKDQLPGILGTVGDLISVPKGYRIAVEAALGEQAHYMVIDRWENIGASVEYLRKKKSGRVTFVALDRIPEFGSEVPSGPEHKDLGKIDSLISFVKCSDDLKKVLYALLQDVFFVDSDDLSGIASELQRSVPCRLVNRFGEINSVGYIFSGGSVSEETVGIVGRKDRINELAGEIDSVSTEIDKFEHELVRLNEHKGDLQLNFGKLTRSVEEANRELESIRHKVGITDFEIRKAEETNEQLMKETKQLELFMSDVAKLDSLNYDINVLEGIRDKLQNEKDTLQAEEEALDEQRQEIENEYSEKNSSLSRIREIVSGLEKEAARLRGLVTEYRDEVAKRNQHSKQTGVNIADTESHIKELKQNLDNLFNQQKKFDDTILEMRQDLSELQDEKQKEYSGFKSQQKRSEELREQAQELKESLMEQRQELRFTEEILNQKDLEVREIEADEYEGTLEELNQKIQEKRRKMENFGPVNLEAVEEYERERERLEFLQNQAGDLEEAEKTLQETIRKINKTARSMFLDIFDKLNDNFKQIFSSFFGNGLAELKMDENEDPLEARIEIYAQPFGKRIQNISMLSGGEKTLTAIALLFAVYMEKPSPFCILDEVDAPLDDSNISRFIKMLQQFSDDTQFIVVTHNKKTMEAAETLYGVTMEESGISKLVSVLLNKGEVVEESE